MAHHALGMALHSSQPASGHGLAWELTPGSRTGGAENSGLEGGSLPKEERGPSRKCLSAADRAGAIETRGTSGSGLGRSRCCGRCALFSSQGFPDRPIAPGVPARRTVLDLACHVTESHRRPEVACVTATEIPAVVNVISRAGLESEGRPGFGSHFRGVGLTVPLSAFVKIT